jgi:crotonobetainyl-CoA:carnitine CoA-transferase CaiB-like acyl-CoA transferase
LDTQPLAGRTFTSASRAPAAEIATFLLADLGATIQLRPTGSSADLADRASDTNVARVVLSPYGVHGRFADAPAHHSAVEAVGGAHVAQYTYAPGPAYLVTPYSDVAQGALTAAGLIASEVEASRSRRTVSALQGLLALQAGFYAFGAERESRFDSTPRGQSPTYSTYQAADDWIFIGASTTPFMIKVLQATGLDDVLAQEGVAEGPRAFRNNSGLAAQVWERIGAEMRRHPRALAARLRGVEGPGRPHPHDGGGAGPSPPARRRPRGAG